METATEMKIPVVLRNQILEAFDFWISWIWISILTLDLYLSTSRVVEFRLSNFDDFTSVDTTLNSQQQPLKQ